ncbi:phospholipase D family protein [candidate division WOR-3 bacterium]|nr:phospholipase D family protein [candidate division WOR-3 bacterium]
MSKRNFILCSIILFFSSFNLLAKTRVLFSPNGGCTKEIIAQIDSSKKTIDIAMFSFTSDSIAFALVRAFDRGIKIRMLLDKQQAKSRYSKYEFLKNYGINTILDRHSGYMHNKIVVIDTAVVLTGSFNWTKNAEKRNEENLLVIDNEEIVKVYQKRLGYLWEWDK